MAPPFTFTFAMSGWCSFSHASTTDANASLISTRSMSSMRQPARSSTLVVAGIGPVSIITGSTPASANVWKRARGVRPSCVRLLLAHDQHGGGAVGDLRRVAGGDHAAVGLERRLQLGELLDVVSGRMPSSCETIVARRPRRSTVDRDDLAVEAALFAGARGALVRLRPRTRRAPRGRCPTSRRSARPRCPAARGSGSASVISGPNGKPTCRRRPTRPSARGS